MVLYFFDMFGELVILLL